MFSRCDGSNGAYSSRPSSTVLSRTPSSVVVIFCPLLWSESSAAGRRELHRQRSKAVLVRAAAPDRVAVQFDVGDRVEDVLQRQPELDLRQRLSDAPMAPAAEGEVL